MKHLPLISVLLIALSVPALAQQGNIPVKPSNFTYNYVDIDYIDLDNGQDGFNIEASYDITQNINVIGSLGFFEGGSNDYTRLSGSAGYHFGVGQAFETEKLNAMDLMIHVGLEYTDSERNSDCGKGNCNRDKDDLDIFIGTEARYPLTELLEVYADLSSHSALVRDLSLSSGLRFSVNESIRLTAGFEIGDRDAISIGGRFNF